VRVRSWAIAIAAAMTFGCSSVQPEVGDRLEACVDADSNPAKDVDFKTEIRPIIDEYCARCHVYGRGSEEGYRAVHFDQGTLGTLKKGGTNTAANIIVPGKPCSSALVKKLQGTFGDARMPKGGPYWTEAQIQLVIDWIAEGAQGADTD
jgi:hypothetical protein